MTDLSDQLPGADTIENRARQALEAEISKSPEGETTAVGLWDDEWEQWHVVTSEDAVELPLRAARAYAFAQAVWAEAQAILDTAVYDIEETFPQDARDHGWHHELFRGEITRAELDARLEPCPHPEDQRRPPPFEGGPERCERCAQYLRS